ncbi:MULTISPECIES: hypothetical protein [Pandoraea]|nr:MULTISPECIES: hypothetical protein [Pandoraea]
MLIVPPSEATAIVGSEAGIEGMAGVVGVVGVEDESIMAEGSGEWRRF